MRERKVVKIRVDMYEDTKFKLIDTMEDRDVIHYIWTRLLTLCGKVNREGSLYISKNKPYTIETLAIEFNRSENKVKLALDTFIDLEMVELVDGVYTVINFAKHQNIKPKEENKNIDTETIENDKTVVALTPDICKKTSNKKLKSKKSSTKKKTSNKKRKDTPCVINFEYDDEDKSVNDGNLGTVIKSFDFSG